ncbi:MAG TPA: type I DNA topoisomerase, partial [Flexilinea sp.]|nr:type I DNA topoisomerase [Flexilinea sp.]
ALNQARKELPKAQLEPEKVGRKCPQCGKDLVIRNGKYGKFISCSGFPQCRYTEQIVEKLDVPCPKCGKELIVRRSKNGRIFYGCSGYPECQFTSWKKPVKQKCPNCGGMLVEMNRDTLQCIECKTKVENKDSE